MLVEPLGNYYASGGLNGGVIATPDLTVVSQHLLLPQIARHAVDRLRARGTQVWVFSGQDWLVRDPDGPYVPLEERTIGFRPTIVEDFGSALEAAAKIVGVSTNFDVLEQCEHNVRAALDDGAFVARSQPYYLDITHPLANKGAALSEIAKLLGIPLAEIAVIGDGGNDVAMFERAGLSIAMGNASSEVQREADLVTASNRDDGFANAIKRFILSDGRSQVRENRAKQEIAHGKRPIASQRKSRLSSPLFMQALETAEKVLTPRAEREGSPDRRNRFCHYQRSSAARHGDAEYLIRWLCEPRLPGSTVGF